MKTAMKSVNKTYGGEEYWIRAFEEDGGVAVRVFRSDVQVAEDLITSAAREGYMAYNGHDWVTGKIDEFAERIDRGEFFTSKSK